jgi:glycine/D-amino acid oxidase-like deaminating enzyme
MSMKIAILGAGFAGLGFAYHMINLSRGRVRLDLFDPTPIGFNSSGISLGLLHAYSGKKANRAPLADKAMDATHELISVASQTHQKPVVLSNGILRPAVSDQQIEHFAKIAHQNNDTQWWERAECLEKIPNLALPPNGGGLYIKNGLTVNVPAYLEALWQACAVQGSLFRQTVEISADLQENYDAVVIALGANTLAFPQTSKLPLTPIRGQILEYEVPTDFPPLQHSLAGYKQVVYDPKTSRLSIGATYERQFQDMMPNPAEAEKEILPKVESFFPSIKQGKLVNTRVGMRATTPDHLPLIGRVDEKHWFLTGLGSKGLLYHALAGKSLAAALLNGGNEAYIPKEFHWNLKTQSRPS